jgi:branched-chain amino acid transport system ATP-binding protein
MEPLLRVEGLSSGYDGNPVIWDVDLHVEAGEVVALLGPNGAGKTTTLLTIQGFLSPIAGSIHLDGADIGGTAPNKLTTRGVQLVPDDRGLIPSLTVADHFKLLSRQVVDPFELFKELKPLARRRACDLSGGEQQMLALARAMAPKPRLLLIDEISQGLAPIIVQRLMPRLREAANDWSTGILLVEQHVSQALAIADRGYVITNGLVTLSADAAELLERRELLESAYLG